MRLPSVDLAGLKKPAWWEMAIRFVFGGLVTVGTGLIDKRFGPAWGGMFIAFPSILPASLTMVKRHDGRPSVVDDARGARIGTFGLLAFALVVTATSTILSAPWALSAATSAWFVVASALWLIQYGRK